MIADTTHKCPKNGCYRRVPRHQLACPKHWLGISAVTRSLISAAYQRRDWGAHSRALSQAIVELNGSPKPAQVDDATLDQLWKEGALA